MIRRLITGMIMILLGMILLAGCSGTKYLTLSRQAGNRADSSYISPTGETIGWDDIKHMPR
jgi:hypothetical protein